MKTKKNKTGSTLVLAIVLLTVSSLIVGSFVTMTMNYSSNLRRTRARDQALFLADSGLRVAFNRLLADKSAVISRSDSRKLFSDTSMFSGSSDWGFSSATTLISGKTNLLQVTGFYGGLSQSVEMWVVDTSTSTEVTGIFKKTIYEGDPNSTLEFYDDDFIDGPVHVEGNLVLHGSAKLPYSEADADGNSQLDTDETWQEAGVLENFDSALTKAEYDAYYNSVKAYEDRFNVNKVYDPGEAFVDSEGNGIYDEGEEFTDLDGDGKYDAGDTFIDRNGNDTFDAGVDTVVDNGNNKYDAGEQHVDDSGRRENGVYDPAGGYYDDSGVWRTSYTETYWQRYWWSWKKVTRTVSCDDWPAEQYEDAGDGIYQPGEPFVETGNGFYDEGELFLDDRNGEYDVGTTAGGTISGMNDPAPGQLVANGGDTSINPSNLKSMYYEFSRDEVAPVGALSGWGHDVKVTASDFNGHLLKNSSKPEHIFIRNPPTSGSRVYEESEYVYARSYTPIYYRDSNGNIINDASGNAKRVDDYFLEDPTDSTYNSSDSSASIDGTVNTRPMYIDVKENGNEKVYYVDGNLYIHSPNAYSMRFKEAGTKITIVVKGNITISDEFYYNADYDEDLTRSGMNSTVVKNAQDALCLIALNNSELLDTPGNPAPSGNIYIGDRQFGTGGTIHSMLYAENNFVDNNVSSANQPFISIYGNMAAGNRIAINRTEDTRLDVTLDRRVSNNEIYLPGLPPPMEGDARTIAAKGKVWKKVVGSWRTISPSELKK